MLDLNVKEDTGNELALVVNFDSEINHPVSIARVACSSFLVQWDD